MIKKTLISLCLALFSFQVSAEVVVIVNADNGVANMKKSEISRIFLGKTQSFSDGSKAVAINQISASNSRGKFDSEVLGRSTTQINAYWSKQMFSGSGTPPEELNGDLAVLQHVAKNPEAIGYIESSALNDSVKAVTIQ